MVSREHVYSQDAGTPPQGQAPLEHPLVQTGPLLLLAYKEETCIVRGQVILRAGTKGHLVGWSPRACSFLSRLIWPCSRERRRLRTISKTSTLE